MFSAPTGAQPSPNGISPSDDPEPSPRDVSRPSFIDAQQVRVSHLNRLVPREKGARKVVDNTFSLSDVAEAIRTNEDLQRATKRVRDALEAAARKSQELGLEIDARKDKAFVESKKALPAIVPASAATPGTVIRNLAPATANGLFGYDIDEHRPVDVAAVRADLIATPGVAMVGVSASGDAIWAILAGPVASSREEYRAHWQALAKQLPPSARANNGPHSHDFGRARAVAHDPDLWLASEPVRVLDGASAAEIAQQEALGRDHNGNGTGYEPGTVDEDDIARLPGLEVDQTYNGWLYQLGMLKACGFSTEQVAQWSTAGGKHVEGEVSRKWATLPSDPPNIAKARFLEATEEQEQSWGRGWSAPHGIPAIGPWFQIAEWWVRTHSHGHFIYDATPESLGWWWYDGRTWHLLSATDPKLIDLIAKDRYAHAQQLQHAGCRDSAELLASDSKWRAARTSSSHDFQVGLRDQLRGAAPSPQPHHYGVANGVVDLRDGTLLPHAPQLGTRGITKGVYLPDDAPQHLQVLMGRFGKVFAPQTLRDYLRLLGLSMTGLAQSYRSIVMVIGESGSGKGDSCNIAQRALGDRGYAVSAAWLGQQARGGDIDATAADLLIYQPSMIRADELGGDTNVAAGRLMGFFGNAPTSARRPHGPVIQGTVQGQMWTTAVAAPSIPRHSGIERRLAVLPTIGQLDPSQIDELGGYEPGLFNAVVTLAIGYAQAVYRPGYGAPAGDAAKKVAALTEMDELAAWLETQDDLQGKGVSEVWNLALHELGLDKTELSQTKFGNKLRLSKKWDKTQVGGGGRIVVARGPEQTPTDASPVSLLPE